MINDLTLYCRRAVAFALMTMVAASVLLCSCKRQENASAHGENTHYAQVDSLMRTITDVDSLAAMAQRYHDDDDAVGEMLALKRQGGMLRDNCQFDKAIATHNRCLEVASELPDTIVMTDALSNIAANYRRLGELSKGYKYYYDALRLCDAYSDHESDEAIDSRAVALNGIGKIEIDMHNYATADSLLRQALADEVKLGSNVGMAMNYSNLGYIKCCQNDLDSAWFYYRKAMEYNKLGGLDKGIALCHLHIGKLYEAERRFSHAKEEYKKAYEGLAGLDNWHWLESCLALSSVCVLLGEESEARDYVLQAEAEALRINSKDHQAKAYKHHYELALLEGRPDEALKYYVHSKELSDSINGPEKTDEMRTQRLNYERSLKSGEVDVLNNDIARLKRMRNMMIVFVVLASLMAGAIIFALVYAMRVRSRTQRVMRQIEETRSLFFTNVVHRLRTPLTAIMGSIDSIGSRAKSSNNQLSPEMVDDLEVIDRQGNNLLDLVDRILEVGSVRSAISGLDWRTGNVVPFIRMIIESYRERCVDRNIELTYTSREKEIVMDAVPSYLSTIVGNLVENAINYSRDFSKITVTTRQEKDALIIRVADNGMGISQTDLPHVFEPFYRGAVADQLIEGVGIGLTVVRDMVMALGGSVDVESEKDVGSVFTVKLPFRHDKELKSRLSELVDPVLKIRPKRHVTQVTPSTVECDENGDRPVVLVVEDHGDVAQLVGHTLEKMFVVHYASDGEQGLARALDLIPDLIVTDVKMPAFDGCELCRRVRQSRQLCHIPIIMLSARTSKEDRIRGIKAGADVYMVKPFISEEMVAFATRLLKNRRMSIEHYSDTLNKSLDRQSPDQEATVTDDDQAFINRFDELVGEQVAKGANRIDLDKVAVALRMGESAMRRKVQTITGKNVVARITQLRMEKALTLLRQHPDMLVGDIAEQCGFVDVAYFSRVFRQHYGMTPTQARNTR